VEAAAKMRLFLMPVKCYFHLFSDNFLVAKSSKNNRFFLSGLQTYTHFGKLPKEIYKNLNEFS
jgi:hypothetical protein